MTAVLSLPTVGHYRADLAVEVGKLELIEIGDRKTADAQACEQVRAPDTTHSRDGNPLGPQGELLPVGEPAQITIEGRGGAGIGWTCACWSLDHIAHIRCRRRSLAAQRDVGFR